MSTQSEKLTAIANAIRAKEGSSDPIPANDFPARIAAIETGIQLPTLTNPGAAADLAQGKQLLDQEGKIVNGGLYEVPYNLVCNNGIPGTGSSGDIPAIYLQGSLENAVPANVDLLVRKDKGVYVYSPATNFGNATAADVAYGKTFTSEAGVQILGTKVETPPVFYTVVQPSSPGYQIGGLDLYNYPYNVMPKLISVFSLSGITSYSNTFDSLVLLNGVGGFYSGQNIRGTINSADIVFEEIQDLDPTKFVVQKGSNSISIRLPGSGNRFFFFDGGTQYVVAIGV